MKRRISLVKWATFEFKFEEILSSTKEYDMETVSLTHHSSWFSDRKNYALEFAHLLKQFIPIFVKALLCRTIVFGTNACRILYIPAFCNSKVILIINEIPSKFNIIDRIFLKHLSSRVYLSSVERLNHFEDLFGTKFGGVVPNIPIMTDVDLNQTKYENKIIYAGLINSKRLPAEVFNTIDNCGYILDLIGPVINYKLTNFKCDYLGVLTQDMSQELQSKYRFALLSYMTDDINNDLCAPIKVYEYVNNYCVCICVNDNKGLVNYISMYPNLFVRLNDLNEYTFVLDDYIFERNEFFREENLILDKSVRTFF
ncbi:hypothetical protein ACRN9Z_13310 [Shewanella frigidimarina]|uniref:hypothetical protein n=1 Tax=Shewanella frigidimarina TaxID=56812 RepID=UPI003D7BE468